MLLADLGATVIKVENPREPDYARGFPPALHAASGEEFSAFFAQFNRNKMGMTLDLATPEGKDLLRRLVTRADVVVENFRAGTMDKLGVGYEELITPTNPRGPAPKVGEHTDLLMRALVDLDDEQIAALRAAGAI